MNLEEALTQLLADIKAMNEEKKIVIKPTQLLMSPEIAEQVREQATAAGYDDPMEYVAAVLAGKYI